MDRDDAPMKGTGAILVSIIIFTLSPVCKIRHGSAELADQQTPCPTTQKVSKVERLNSNFFAGKYSIHDRVRTTMKSRAIIVVSLFLLTLLLGCENSKGPSERAGEKVDKAVEDTGNAIEDAVDKVGDKLGK